MGLFSDFTSIFGIGPRMTPGEERGFEEEAAGTQADLEIGEMRFGEEGTERYGIDVQEALGELRYGEEGTERYGIDVQEALGELRYGEEGTERYGIDIQKMLGELQYGTEGIETKKLKLQELLGLKGFQTQKEIAAMTSPTGYAGQRGIASGLASFLGERMGEGLTSQEKALMRGAGRTGILQAAQSATSGLKKAFAGQGLRGGAVAGGLAGIEEAKIPAFGRLETEISTADLGEKRRRVAESLSFLGLKAAPTVAGV
jgi:hypothetical protein